MRSAYGKRVEGSAIAIGRRRWHPGPAARLRRATPRFGRRCLPFLRRESLLEAARAEVFVLNFRGAASRQAAAGISPLQRCQVPSSSIVRILRKISRSLFGSSEAGISMPRMEARTRMSGLRPHHFPSPVSVWPVARLALLVRLRGEAGDGELGFDEGGHEETPSQSVRESWECPKSSRRARGDMPSPFTNGLSAIAARSALRQPRPFCMAWPVVATVMV